MMPSLGELSSSFQTPNSRFDDFAYLILMDKVIRFFLVASLSHFN